MNLEKKRFIPFYMKVKTEIMQSLLSGKYKPGDKIPAERVLAKEMNVSRITVTRAIKELTDEGYFTRYRGRGTIVTDKRIAPDSWGVLKNFHVPLKVTFGLLSPSNEHKLLYRLLANEFQLQFPKVHIEITDIEPPKDPTCDPYMIRMSSGNPPTVGDFYFHADYAALGGLVALDELPGFDDVINSYSCCKPTSTINSHQKCHVHALPYRVSTRTLLVNLDMLKQAGIQTRSGPENWDELSVWVEALSKYAKKQPNDHYGFYSEIPRGWHGTISYLPYLWASGKGKENNSLLDLAHQFGITPVNPALTFLQNLHKKGKPYKQSDFTAIYALGRLGMLMSTTYEPERIRKIAGNNFESAAFLIPGQTGGKISISGESSLGIFSGAVENQEQCLAAWEWIKFLLRPECQALISQATGSIPVRHSSICQTDEHTVLSIQSEALPYAVSQYDFPALRKALWLCGCCIQKILFNRNDAGLACRELQHKLEALQLIL